MTIFRLIAVLIGIQTFVGTHTLCLAEESDSSETATEADFIAIFDGKSLDGWIGAKDSYQVQDGMIVSLPGKGGNMLTEKQYSDFILRFEFQLTPASNNGIGLRIPKVGAHAATLGMEIQILDEKDAKYRNLKPYQYHGSVYGLIPSKQGHLKPLGEWNSQEIRCIGKHVTVILNGTTIVDGNILDAIKDGAMDGREHPGVKNTTGHIGLLGHKTVVKLRNLRVKEVVK